MFGFMTSDYRMLVKGKSKKQVLHRLKKLGAASKHSTIEDFCSKTQDNNFPVNGAILRVSKTVYKAFDKKGQDHLSQRNLIGYRSRIALGSNHGARGKRHMSTSIIVYDGQFILISREEFDRLELFDCIESQGFVDND